MDYSGMLSERELLSALSYGQPGRAKIVCEIAKSCHPASREREKYKRGLTSRGGGKSHVASTEIWRFYR